MAKSDALWVVTRFWKNEDDEIRLDTDTFMTELAAFQYIRSHMAVNIQYDGYHLCSEDIGKVGDLLLKEPTQQVMDDLIKLWTYETDEGFHICAPFPKAEVKTPDGVRGELMGNGFTDIIGKWGEVPAEVHAVARLKGFTAARALMQQITDEAEEAEDEEWERKYGKAIS
jgi:hypothetical protein